MNTIIQLYIASMKEFMRDRMAIFWTLGFPVMFILIFGVVFSGGDDIAFPVALVNLDDGPIGSELVSAFTSIESFEVAEGERAEMASLLEEGHLRLVVVIPEDFSSNVSLGETTAIEVIYDPTNQTSAQIVLAIVRELVNAFEREISQRPLLMSISTTSVTSDRLRQIDFMVPGILGMAIMQLGLMSTAPQLVSLREQKVLRRMGATPLSRSTLLISQVLNRLTVGVAQTSILIVLGFLVFDVSVAGSIPLLMGISLLGTLMFVALGYMIAAFSKTLESVTGLVSFINFPMMFLSGLFFPIEIMPDWVRPIVSAIPLTYLVDALRQVMIASPPQFSLQTDLIVVSIWLVVCSLLAWRFFRWE